MTFDELLAAAARGDGIEVLTPRSSVSATG